MVPDDVAGRVKVKVVYTVLEAQYQSALSAAVKEINKTNKTVRSSGACGCIACCGGFGCVWVWCNTALRVCDGQTECGWGRRLGTSITSSSGNGGSGCAGHRLAAIGGVAGDTGSDAPAQLGCKAVHGHTLLLLAGYGGRQRNGEVAGDRVQCTILASNCVAVDQPSVNHH